jgi:hypothetical protein
MSTQRPKTSTVVTVKKSEVIKPNMTGKALAKQLAKKESEKELEIGKLIQKECDVLMYLCWELAQWRDSEPGYSCVGGTDVTKHFKWNGKITSGVMSSLARKGFVYSDDEFVDISYPVWSKIPNSFGRVDKITEVAKPIKSNILLGTDGSVKVKPTMADKLVAAEKKIAKSVPLPKGIHLEKPVFTDAEIESYVAAVKKTASIVVGKKYKPFEKYGVHGKNVVLKGFIENCIVEFQVKGVKQLGQFRHFHINNHSPKGYAVINHDGKIIERAVGNFKLYSGEPKKTAIVKRLDDGLNPKQQDELNEKLDKVQEELLQIGFANLAKLERKVKARTRAGKTVPSVVGKILG